MLSKLGKLWVSSEGMGVVCAAASGSWVDAWGRDNRCPDRNSHKIRQARAPVNDPRPSTWVAVGISEGYVDRGYSTCTAA